MTVHAPTSMAAEPRTVPAWDVVVVICTYTDDRWPLLESAVASALGQSLPPAEVVVVVDHNDELLARVRAQLPVVRAFANVHPRGLAGAKNTAIAATSSEFVAFLDDDAEATPEWLARLMPGFREETVAGIGSVVVARWSPARPAWFPAEFDWVVGCTHQDSIAATTQVRNVLGGASVLRRSVFERVGGYRLELGRVGRHPLGGEETELCIRVRQRLGAGFLLDPGPNVSQTPPPDRTTWRYFRRRCYAEGLSKAVVTRLVGPRDGLTSEAHYATRVLPRAVARELRGALHGEPLGWARAAAILGGLAWTTAGYVVGLAGAVRRTAATPPPRVG